jgi:NitT/TauT family transport system substrate-binding protein
MPRSLVARAAAALLVVFLVVGCSPQPGSGSPAASALGSPARTQLTVGLGYIPSVQFAPFYLADQQGYYRAAGLDVTFQNKIDPDLVTLVGQGAIDIGVADGTSVIPARSQGIPVRYLATIYGTYPSIVFAKTTSDISAAGELKGKKIGIPGRYGSSWIMLQALLGSAQLTVNDVTIIEYPDFGQGAAVQQGAVDAATGFANNEPVQLKVAGVDTVVLHVDGIVALPGPGLISSDATLGAKHDAVAAFVGATVKAMREIEANPKVGVDAAIQAVPELASQRSTQEAILDATIATWAPPSGGPDQYGRINRAGWQASIDYLGRLGLVPNSVTVDDLVREVGLPS